MRRNHLAPLLALAVAAVIAVAPPALAETPDAAGDLPSGTAQAASAPAGEEASIPASVAGEGASSSPAAGGPAEPAPEPAAQADAPDAGEPAAPGAGTSDAGLSAQAASAQPEPAVPAAVAAPAQAASPASTATRAAQPATGRGDLAAGTYYLSSALSASQVVDVKGAKRNDGANIIVWHVNGQANERWKVEIGADGYAILRSALSGKVLDVSGGKAKRGANVIQWKETGGANQKWIIRKQDGYYALHSALGGNLVLDLSGNKAADGTNVGVWTRNGGKNQLFSFIPATPDPAAAGDRTVADGVYNIASAAAGGRLVDIEGGSTANGGNALVWQGNGGANQAFDIAYDGAGYYTITGVRSGKVLAPAAACAVPGINVAQYAVATDLAKWRIDKAGSGYRLVNKATGLALNVNGGKNANGANLEAWRAGTSTSQLFTLASHDAMPEGPSIIEVAGSTRLVLDVYSGSLSKGAAVGTYAAGGGMNQRFLVSRHGSGYTIRPFNSRLYLTASAKGTLVQDAAHAGMSGQVWNPVVSKGRVSLVNADSGLALTMAGGAAKASPSITLAARKAGDAQQFYLRKADPVGEGVYYITASSNESKVLDVAGASRKNGANVDLWQRNGGNNQKFLITSEGDGLYRITSVATGRSLDVKGASRADGANVIVWTAKDAANQKWRITLNDDFSLSFTSALSGKRLDMAGGKVANGTNIRMQAASAAGAQEFWLQPAVKGNEVVKIGVPCYIQNPELPTGCESVALTNALRYWGFKLGKSTIANSWMPYGSDGVYNFIGNPRNSSGWIICAPGITNTANKFLKSKKSSVRAKNVTGTSLKNLRKYLDQGCPVVVWTTIGMGNPGPATYKHGYPLRSNNHAVVLTGYNPKTGNYQVADSLAGTVWRNGSRFNSLYNAMGKQAVVLVG